MTKAQFTEMFWTRMVDKLRTGEIRKSTDAALVVICELRDECKKELGNGCNHYSDSNNVNNDRLNIDADRETTAQRSRDSLTAIEA